MIYLSCRYLGKTLSFVKRFKILEIKKKLDSYFLCNNFPKNQLKKEALFEPDMATI